MQSIDYSKISITAKLVAYFRQFSDIPFAQDVSGFVRAEEALQEIASMMESEDDDLIKLKETIDQVKVYAPLLESRYKSIVQVILKTGVKQVLELASGYSLRGLAMSQDKDIFYVESDLSGVNEEKIKLVVALRAKYDLIDLGNHQIVTANALERSDLVAATAHLKHDQPLIVVNEGLILYLTAEERATLAGNVRYLLGQFAGGAWITPDFTTRQLADEVSEHRKRLRKAILGATERELQGAAFDSEQSISDFIGEHGFTGNSTYQTDEVTNLVSPGRLGLSGQVVERLKPHMRIWLLSPRA
jgi:O-methyltransferase involved in polyketide biosynthesis